MKNVLVTLEWEELSLAAQIGARRRVVSMWNNLKDRGFGPSDWNVDIEAAAAEMAFAKYIGVYCIPRTNSFKDPDVGPYQVRSTKYPDGRLIIRPHDNDNENYVLVVTSELPIFRIVGLFNGRSAKTPEFNHQNDSWWVPQSRLLDLPDQLFGRRKQQ